MYFFLRNNIKKCTMIYDSFTLINVQAWRIVLTMGFPFLLTKVREFLRSMLPFLEKVLWFYWWFKALILSKLMMPAAADKASFRIFAEYSKFIMKCGASSHPRSPSPAPRHSPPCYSFNVVIPIWNHHIRLFNKFISLKNIVLKSYSSWLLSFLALH